MQVLAHLGSWLERYKGDAEMPGVSNRSKESCDIKLALSRMVR
jgi:hypothetical protein